MQTMTHSTNQSMQSCIDACNKCMQTCEECMTDCLEEADVKARVHCINLLRECAALCGGAAQTMARGGGKYASQVCGICANICDECASACAQFKDPHCQQCADMCNQCAGECRKMAQ